MSFLKKLGSVLKVGAQIGAPMVPGVGPLLVPVVNQLLPKRNAKVDQISEVIATIIQVEAQGQAEGKHGVEMAEDAAPLIAQLLMRSTLFKNRNVLDTALFDKGMKNIAGGFADVMNSFQEEDIALGTDGDAASAGPTGVAGAPGSHTP